MVELKGHELVFSFPEVHRAAKLRISFQRTMRIPDNDEEYPLPPGLGTFPLVHVDDHACRVPSAWLKRGGVMLPMYQSEALWISFDSRGNYPFLVKIAAGKINAVTGKPWSLDPVGGEDQDYLAIPGQPWLDGFAVGKGIVRQFVAMPLGSGYSAEEQITGKAEHGGIQIMVKPIKAKVYERTQKERLQVGECEAVLCASGIPDMGLAPGGKMKQQIYEDDFKVEDYDSARSRCFVHIANSLMWESITGSAPPDRPPTAREYTRAGLPWFDYYDDGAIVEGSQELAALKSVSARAREVGDKKVLLDHDDGDFPVDRVVKLGQRRRNEPRDGEW